ncbi:sulfatase [Pseudoxanthomonas putridarboris]|uniref:Sulfatase n=1 Tax=Pseudoxanthomonas putridarboris TaxID=752605 RepID=A0ABU9J4V9_9GAMM
MTFSRRRFLSGSVLSSIAALTGAGVASAVAEERKPAVAAPAARGPRNVLLIVADDQGLDAGVYGGPVRTPAIDALAAEGCLFEQAYATVSSCSPSRSVLYTGLYSHTNGMYGLAHGAHNQSLLAGVRTLPWRFRQAGHATALVGKHHVTPESALPYDAWLAPEQPGNRDVAFMAREAGRFIRAQGGRPFFLTVGYSDPHRAERDFANADWPQVERMRYSPVDVVVPDHLPDLPDVRTDLAQYYESVSRLDAGIGLLLAQLHEAGHGDDTLVVYLSDNGRAFPGAKTTLYDAGIHLPLVIRAPGRGVAGLRSDAMVSWIDIAPTLLDWAGIAVPEDEPHGALPGRSLLPLLAGGATTGRDAIYGSHGFHEIDQYYPMRTVRNRRHQYILNLAPELPYPIAGDVASSPSWAAIRAEPGARLGRRTLEAFLHRPAEELYDLQADPAQVDNLAADPAHGEVLATLRRQLTDWRARTRDPWLSGQTSPFGHAGH